VTGLMPIAQYAVIEARRKEGPSELFVIALQRVRSEELFIFQAPVPRSLAAEQNAAAGTLPQSPYDITSRNILIRR
jgi:hypothetical protein